MCRSNKRRNKRRREEEETAHLVATFVDDLQDVGRQGILLPVPDGVRDLASLGGNAVVLSEDSPVSVRHLIQLLLRPVPVIPALLSFLLSHLLQPGPETRVKVIVGGEGRVEDGKVSACLTSAAHPLLPDDTDLWLSFSSQLEFSFWLE